MRNRYETAFILRPANDRMALRAGAGRLRVVEPDYTVSAGMAPVECNPASTTEAEAPMKAAAAR